MTDYCVMMEAGQVVDQFVCGIGRIENLGTCSRVTFYTPKQYSDGRTYSEATLAVIVPNSELVKQPAEPPARMTSEREDGVRLN